MKTTLSSFSEQEEIHLLLLPDLTVKEVSSFLQCLYGEPLPAKLEDVKKVRQSKRKIILSLKVCHLLFGDKDGGKKGAHEHPMQEVEALNKEVEGIDVEGESDEERFEEELEEQTPESSEEQIKQLEEKENLLEKKDNSLEDNKKQSGPFTDAAKRKREEQEEATPLDAASPNALSITPVSAKSAAKKQRKGVSALQMSSEERAAKTASNLQVVCGGCGEEVARHKVGVKVGSRRRRS